MQGSRLAVLAGLPSPARASHVHIRINRWLWSAQTLRV
jgi:hypothetical protein